MSWKIDFEPLENPRKAKNAVFGHMPENVAHAHFFDFGDFGDFSKAPAPPCVDRLSWKLCEDSILP